MMKLQSLAVWISVSSILQTALGASQSDECLVQFTSPVKHTISCSRGKTACSNQALQSEFPDLYNSSIWRAPAPASFTPQATCLENPDAKTARPAIAVTWKLPDDRGASLITGFDIRVQGHMRDFRCIVVKLEENVKSSGMSFSGILTSVDHSNLYRITLQSLPRNNVSGMLHEDVQMKDCVQHSGSWTIEYFKASYNHVTQQLHVAFDRPPDRFGFEEFELKLLSLSVSRSLRINETQFTFEDISPGDYDILITPYDPYRFVKGKCKCKIRRDICGTCTMNEFKYTAKAGVPNVNTPSNSDDTTRLAIGVVIGCVFVVALAVAAIAVYRGSLKIPGLFQRRSKDSTEQTKPVIVFIDPSDINTTAVNKRQAFAIESYRQRLDKEAHFHIAENAIKSVDTGSIRDALAELLNTSSGADSSKDTSCVCFNVCKNGNMDSWSVSVDKTIVCCFVLSERLSARQVANLEKVDKLENLKVVNVALTSDKAMQETMRSFNAMKCFKIPDQHSEFVNYMYIKSATTCIDKSDDALQSSKRKYRSTCLNVDIDYKSSSKEKENLISDRHVTPAIDQLSPELTNGRRHVIKTGSHVADTGSDASPVPSRERYVSNDSGKGGSVESYRCSFDGYQDREWEPGYGYHVDDHLDFRSNNFRDMRSGELNHPPKCRSDVYFSPPDSPGMFEFDFDDRLMTNHQGGKHFKNIPELRMSDLRTPPHCPSHISFIQPEPLEISESDILDSYRSVYAKNGYIPMQNCRHAIAEDECMYTCDSADDTLAETSEYGVGKTDDNSSMDVLVSKMAAINKRTMHIMSVDAQAGDTFTVFEEKV